MSLEAVVDAEVVRSAAEWAEVIKADLSSAVEGIVAAGQHLIAAKADVRHGQWLPMLKQIGISHTAAKELMAIGGNPAISNSRNCDHLPTAARALYELSRLPAEQIEEHIASGAITPDMTISQTKVLVNPPAEPDPEPAVAQCIHCGDTLPLTQLYEGGQGYECDPCVSSDEPEVSTDTCRDCDGHGCETCFPEDDLDDANTVTFQHGAGFVAPGGEIPIDTETTVDIDTGEVIEEKPIPTPDPERKQRKHPLPDSFWRATFDLKKRAESVVRLAADDRFKKNKDQIADVNLSDLVRVRDALTGVIQQLEG